MDVTAKIAELKSDIAKRRAQALENPEQVDAAIKNAEAAGTSAQQGQESQLSFMADANELQKEIMRIYTLADNITNKIELADKAIRKIYFDIATPYIDAVVSLAEVAAQYYVEAAKSGWKVTPELQGLVEEEFAEFYKVFRSALDEIEMELGSNKGGMELTSAQPTSPLTIKYLKRPKRGTDGIKILKLITDSKDNNERMFILSIQDLWGHVSQLLLEFEKFGIANFRKGYPPRGFASLLAIKAAATTTPKG